MSKLLIDPYDRHIEYLRVSITDLCNLRCVYCRPPEGVKLVSHDEVLRYEEILTIIEAAQELGVKKIRVTGGEPLVRRGVIDFLARLASLDGIQDLALTTNGVLLSDKLLDLKAAGLTRLNISLDTLRRDVFKAVTGYDGLDAVLKGIKGSLLAGFHPVKVNVVLLAGVNEADIVDFARLTLDYPLEVRFIERMPFIGEHAVQRVDSFPGRKALDMITSELGSLEHVSAALLNGPAVLYQLKNAVGKIGLIEPITGHFCGTCNRLRLTARGTLRPCLMSSREFDIRGPLRAGASQAELLALIRSVVAAKPLGKPAESFGLSTGMNSVGG